MASYGKDNNRADPGGQNVDTGATLIEGDGTDITGGKVSTDVAMTNLARKATTKFLKH